MLIPADKAGRLELRTRVQTRVADGDGFSCRIALADRIATLPNIRVVEASPDALPCRVDVYLHRKHTSAHKQQMPVLFCSISRDGVAVYGLSNGERHQVLCHRWGWLERDRVVVFLPRDDEELEVCWAILQRAYGCLSETSAQSPRLRMSVPQWDLPRYSRTKLQ